MLVAAHAAAATVVAPIAKRQKTTVTALAIPLHMSLRWRQGLSPLSVTVPVFDLEAVQRTAAVALVADAARLTGKKRAAATALVADVERPKRSRC